MLTKEQLNIFSVFKEDVFASFTFKQIKERSKQKSNNVLQIALKEFKAQNIINANKIGDVTTYSLNFDNNLTLSYLGLINELGLHKRKLPKDILTQIQKRISKYTEFFILVVFGSYAKHKATDKSDIDVAVIVESEQTKKEVIPYLGTISRREIIEVDYHVFTRREFVEMLKADYENVGKQIYKNNLVYYGFIEYINLIRGKQNEQ